MKLDGILADILLCPPFYRPSTRGDLRKIHHHSSLQSFLEKWINYLHQSTTTPMRTNLVKIVLVNVSIFATQRQRDVVQVYELLEVWVSVGTVGEVGLLKIVSRVRLNIILLTRRRPSDPSRGSIPELEDNPSRPQSLW